MNASHRCRQSGLSLIEVLISLVVIGIGLLGVAGLQTTAVQSNYLAYQYSMAARLAENLAEAMRSNRSGLLGNAYALELGSPPDAPPIDCSNASCAPEQLGLWQLADWYSMLATPEEGFETTQASLTDALPMAQASVTCADPCDDRSLRVITVLWNATRRDIEGTGCDPQDADDLQCVRLAVSP